MADELADQGLPHAAEVEQRHPAMLGWTRRAIFRAVLAELAAVGLVSGAAGNGLAAVVVAAAAAPRGTTTLNLR